MEEDDYPNFASAFPGASPSEAPAAASWNPAFRPDSDATTKAAPPITQQYLDIPGADNGSSLRQPGESATNALHSVPAGGDDTLDQFARRQSISVEHSVHVTRDVATPQDIENLNTNHVEIEATMGNHQEEQDDEQSGSPQSIEEQQEDGEREIFQPEEAAEVQSMDLDNHFPETSDKVQSLATHHELDGVEQADHAAEPVADQHPEEYYEHQGEVTEMEEALDESAEAPLIADEQPAPTTAFVTRDLTMDLVDEDPTLSLVDALDHSKPTEPAVPPPIERSFTTNFTEPPVDLTEQEDIRDPIAAEWPAVGDDKTFGELLDNNEDSYFEGAVVASEDQTALEADQPKDEDLSAAWAAALDDDDILDDTNELDPSDLFGDDDEGFLQDDEPFLPEVTAGFDVPSQQSHYAGSYPPNLDLSHGRSAGTPSTGLDDIYNQQEATQLPTKPALMTAQSFADKAKGGYQSPYDLPMDVVKPRRRPQQVQQQLQAPTPPPRSTSFHGTPIPPSAAVPSPPNSSHSNAPGPSPLGPGASPSLPASTTSKTTPKFDAGFFADLPVTAKPRLRPAASFAPQPVSTPPMGPPQGTYTPRSQSPALFAPPPAPVQHLQRPVLPSVPSSSQQVALVDGLSRPERNPLFPEQQLQAPPTTAPPQTQRRYSPAPGSSAAASAAIPNTSRYSPAPTSQSMKSVTRYASAPTPPVAPVTSPGIAPQPYAPRTSSPLAVHRRPQAPTDRPMTPSSPPKQDGTTSAATLSPERLDTTGTKYAPRNISAGSYNPAVATPALGAFAATGTGSLAASSKTAAPTLASGDRRGSSGQFGSLSFGNPLPAQQSAGQNGSTRLPHMRRFSRDLGFSVPQDERAQDPLERWKGHPIFRWGNGGTIVSSFPKQTAFYSSGTAIPSIKCTPGSANLQDAASLLPLADRDAKFPGPLAIRGKGKKKELLAWVSGKIEDLERVTEAAMLDFNLESDVKKRLDEKVVLWKTARIFLEHDGVLEGNAKVDEEVRNILLPNLAQMSQVAELESPVAASVQSDPVDKQVLLQIRQALFEGQRERAVWLAEEKKLWGHAMLIASTMGPDVWKQIIGSFVRSQVKSVGSDARSLASLYEVFAGNSEECVDELVPPSARAGYQMVSKTDGRRASNPLEGLDQWRETLALIVSNRTPNDGSSLAALGKLLAGYGRIEAAHTCFLFARAFVKHSGADDTDSNFVLLGADHTKGDANLDAIILTEIYEYAASLSASSTTALYIPHLQSFKLIHAQQLAAYGLRAKAQAYCNQIDSAIRSSTKPSGYYHQALAQELMSFNAFLSQTPQVASGSKLFSKPNMDKVSSGVGSWFTKFVAGDEAESESVNSASGSRGEGETTGPFGRLNGTISRSVSTSDLYSTTYGSAGASSAAMPYQPLAAAAGKYAPVGGASLPSASTMNRYAPAASSNLVSSRSSMESDRSYEPSSHPFQGPFQGIPSSESTRPGSARYTPAQGMHSPQFLGAPRPAVVDRAVSDYAVHYDPASRRGSQLSHISNQSYEPRPILAGDDGFGSQLSPPMQQQSEMEPKEEGGIMNDVSTQDMPQDTPAFDPETGSGYEPPTAGGYEPPTASGYEPPSAAGYEPPTAGGYEPPSASGYEPPSFQPYQPEPEPDSPDEAPKLKKKSFMDDDDDADLAARAAALKISNASKADREADAAFRAAAEADAARDDKNADKKGWFGGWFGKKDPNAAPGPIRAKLGEENSFYYDKDLGKWINKKGGSDATPASSATPPPPRAPPGSRTASTSSGPPGLMGPPSRVMSSQGGPPGSGPPSRVGTPMSNAGPGGPPRPSTAVDGVPGHSQSVPPGPPGANGLAMPARPSSSMSTASSLDDLLAGPKKAGGTLKGKKRGGRYVDVMAK